MKKIKESIDGNTSDEIFVTGVRKGCIDGLHSNLELHAFKTLSAFKTWID